MRIRPNAKTTKSYVSRDRLVGEVEDLLNSLYGENASRINWVDVPYGINVDGAVTRWTAVIFLPSDLTWGVRPIAEYGFHVCN
jgi:hypothetical protein